MRPSSGSGVLLALLARLPLGLHAAPDQSTSGGGDFSATTLTPKLKRLRCPGGRLARPSVSEWFHWPELEFLRTELEFLRTFGLIMMYFQ